MTREVRRGSKRAIAGLLAVGVSTLVGAPTATAAPSDPTLEARAILPADATAAAPFPGVPDMDPAPAPGATQPVGGFSALLPVRGGQGHGKHDRGGDGFWAMPDNGFGTKANSRSFLLRVYKVRADFETARGGDGDVEIREWITLADPDGKVPFAIVNEGTDERLLTGGDFDIESFRVAKNGDLWFGDEFGPFLLHTDRTGRVLEAPIPLPDVKSPDYPADYPAPYEGEANLARSNGFEGMALSKDGKRLYPTLEGPVTGDDPTVRRMYEFNLRTGSYRPGYRSYEVADPTLLVSDLTALDEHRMVALERDNFQGAEAAHKRAFLVDLREAAPDGALVKREVVDLLDLADPTQISLPARPDDIGLGDPFAMPYVTIESVLPLRGSRLAIVNDTNFGSTGRNLGLPDYSDFIVVRVPGLRGE
jgi:glycerophosphoryl diester phosphodiesterase